jgi:hypothetical protein
MVHDVQADQLHIVSLGPPESQFEGGAALVRAAQPDQDATQHRSIPPWRIGRRTFLFFDRCFEKADQATPVPPRSPLVLENGLCKQARAPW